MLEIKFRKVERQLECLELTNLIIGPPEGTRFPYLASKQPFGLSKGTVVR